VSVRIRLGVPVNAVVVQLVGDNRLKICTVRVRIPSTAPIKGSNMIDTESCYYEVKTKSEVISNLFPTILDDQWLLYHGFNTLPIPNDIVLKEPFLNKLNSKFKIKQAGILLIEENSFYKWHIDGLRGVGINMLLSHVNSHCLFTEHDYDKKTQAKIVELEYKQDTFYIFNTQNPHTVINFNGPRYMFSVEFEQDKTLLTYDNVKNWAQQD
jgi:hypothetical protein